MALVQILIGLLLIVGGILAVSGLIISKKPEAKALIDKIVPFQGFKDRLDCRSVALRP